MKKSPRLGLHRSLEPTGPGLSGTCLDPFRGLFFGDQCLISGLISSGPGTDFLFFLVLQLAWLLG